MEPFMMTLSRRFSVIACFALAALGTHSSARASDVPKAKFASPLVTAKTPGHAIEIDAEISGAKQLYLVVTDGEDSFACDWSDWAEPRLVGPAGEKKLTDLTWKSASSQWGHVHVN